MWTMGNITIIRITMPRQTRYIKCHHNEIQWNSFLEWVSRHDQISVHCTQRQKVRTTRMRPVRFNEPLFALQLVMRSWITCFNEGKYLPVECEFFSWVLLRIRRYESGVLDAGQLPMYSPTSRPFPAIYSQHVCRLDLVIPLPWNQQKGDLSSGKSRSPCLGYLCAFLPSPGVP